MFNLPFKKKPFIKAENLPASGASFDLISDDIIAGLKEYSQLIKLNLTPDNRLQLGHEFVEAYKNAESLEDWSKRIRSVIAISDQDARVMAQTAMSTAIIFSHEQGYEQAGIDKIQILAVIDNHTCEFCRAHHNQIFIKNIAPKIPCHDGCRCTTIAVFE